MGVRIWRMVGVEFRALFCSGLADRTCCRYTTRSFMLPNLTEVEHLVFVPGRLVHVMIVNEVYAL